MMDNFKIINITKTLRDFMYNLNQFDLSEKVVAQTLKWIFNDVITSKIPKRDQVVCTLITTRLAIKYDDGELVDIIYTTSIYAIVKAMKNYDKCYLIGLITQSLLITNHYLFIWGWVHKKAYQALRLRRSCKGAALVYAASSMILESREILSSIKSFLKDLRSSAIAGILKKDFIALNAIVWILKYRQNKTVNTSFNDTRDLGLEIALLQKVVARNKTITKKDPLYKFAQLIARQPKKVYSSYSHDFIVARVKMLVVKEPTLLYATGCWNPMCCGTIDKAPPLVCGFCKQARYCCLECQKVDWKFHCTHCKNLIRI
jgi:hypothetical protein